MSAASLCGRWKIYADQSGFPPVENPAVFENSLIFSFVDDQSMEVILCKHIEDDGEEFIEINIISEGEVALEASYKLGAFEFTYDFDESVYVTIVQNCDSNLQRMSFSRLGTQSGQRTCEHFAVDTSGYLHLILAAVDQTSGRLYKLNRVFIRQNQYPLTGSSLPLSKWIKTAGWEELSYWPSNIMDLCQVKLIKVERAWTQPPFTKDILWAQDQPVDLIRKTKFAEDPNIPVQINYTLQVNLNGKIWSVVHTLDSVAALNDFVRVQNSSKETADSAFRKLTLQSSWKNYVEMHRHVLALDSTFRSIMQNAQILNQNGCDAICSFLEIPENIAVELVSSLQSVIDGKTVKGIKAHNSNLKFQSLRLNDMPYISAHSLVLPNISRLQPQPVAVYSSSQAVAQRNELIPENQGLQNQQIFLQQEDQNIRQNLQKQPQQHLQIQEEQQRYNQPHFQQQPKQEVQQPLDQQRHQLENHLPYQQQLPQQQYHPQSQYPQQHTQQQQQQPQQQQLPQQYDPAYQHQHQQQVQEEVSEQHDNLQRQQPNQQSFSQKGSAISKLFPQVDPVPLQYQSPSNTQQSGFSKPRSVNDPYTPNSYLGQSNNSIAISEETKIYDNQMQLSDNDSIVSGGSATKQLASLPETRPPKPNQAAKRPSEQEPDTSTPKGIADIQGVKTPSSQDLIQSMGTPAPGKKLLASRSSMIRTRLDQDFGSPTGSVSSADPIKRRVSFFDEANVSLQKDDHKEEGEGEISYAMYGQSEEKMNGSNNTIFKEEKETIEQPKAVAPVAETIATANRTSKPGKIVIEKGVSFDVLRVGLTVIKHGRTGKPKRKRVRCDATATKFLFYNEVDGQVDYKEIRELKLSDIVSVRLGTDIDPASSESAVEAATKEGSLSLGTLKEIQKKPPTLQRRKSFIEKMFVKDEVLYGTAVLRKNCSAEEMKLCLSLILSDRSFDLQFLSTKDLEFFAKVIRDAMNPPDQPVLSIDTSAPVIGIVPVDNKAVVSVEPVVYKENPMQRRNSHYNDDSSLDSGLLGESHLPPPPPQLPPQKAPPHLPPVTGRTYKTQQALMTMSPEDAIQMNYFLLEQEQYYGTNMYEAAKEGDDYRIRKYMSRGFTANQATLRLFEKRYVPKEYHQTATTRREKAVEDDSDSLTSDRIEGPHSVEIRNDEQKIPPIPAAAGSSSSVGIAIDPDDEEMKLAKLLVLQEQIYGVNMYDALTPQDERELPKLIGQGMTLEQAVQFIFEQKYGPTPESGYEYGGGGYPYNNYGYPNHMHQPPRGPYPPYGYGGYPYPGYYPPPNPAPPGRPPAIPTPPRPIVNKHESYYGGEVQSFRDGSTSFFQISEANDGEQEKAEDEKQSKEPKSSNRKKISGGKHSSFYGGAITSYDDNSGESFFQPSLAIDDATEDATEDDASESEKPETIDPSPLQQQYMEALPTEVPPRPPLPPPYGPYGPYPYGQPGPLPPPYGYGGYMPPPYGYGPDMYGDMYNPYFMNPYAPRPPGSSNGSVGSNAGTFKMPPNPYASNVPERKVPTILPQTKTPGSAGVTSRTIMKYKPGDVQAIITMGFTKEQAMWALAQNGNNVVMALNALMDS